MNIGNQIPFYEAANTEFPFLVYLEDIKIGPQKSDVDVLMQIELHVDINKVMTVDDIKEQVSRFTKLVYARFPRFSKNFIVAVKRIDMANVRTQYKVIVKYQ